MTPDLIGCENICSYIEASGKKSFTIKYANDVSKTDVTIFTYNGKNSTECVEGFKNWNTFFGSNGNTNIYRLNVFSIAGDSKSCFIQLNTEKSNNFNRQETQTVSQPQIMTGYISRDEAARMVNDALLQKQQEHEIEELKNAYYDVLDFLENRENENEDDGKDFATQLKTLKDTFSDFKPKEELAISGEEKTDVANEHWTKQDSYLAIAIPRLKKADKFFGTDLLLLANLAEQRPGTFKDMVMELRKIFKK